MKKIEKDEIFQNLSEFLGNKGIKLTDGSYSQTIQKSCRIVADVINMGQQGLEKAKDGIDKKLDQVRQVIHEKTAPKPPKSSAQAADTACTGSASQPQTEAAPKAAGEAGPRTATAASRKAHAGKKKAGSEKTGAKSAKPNRKRTAARRSSPPS